MKQKKVAQRRLLARFGMNILDVIRVFVVSAKSVSYILQSPRLLDQLREVLRYKHYSLRTEDACLYWVKFLFDGMAAEVEQFLTMLKRYIQQGQVHFLSQSLIVANWNSAGVMRGFL